MDNMRVTVVGTAKLGGWDSAIQLVIPMSVGGFEVSVRFVDDRGVALARVMDADICVTGVASTGADVHGNLTDLTILVPDSGGMTIERSAPDPGSLRVQSVAGIVGGPFPEHRVRLRGLIEYQGDLLRWKFSDATGSIAITNALDVNIAANSRQSVDLVGFVERREGGLVALRDVRLTLPDGLLAEATVRQNEAAITSVAQLRALAPEEAAGEKPVSLEGMVTFYDANWQALFLQDGSGGVYVSLRSAVNHPRIRIGDRFRVRGVCGAGNFAPIVMKPELQLIGHGVLPVAPVLRGETVFSGLADSQWVEMEGIVRSIGMEGRYPVAQLSWGVHEYKAILPSTTTIPREWIDGRFRVRGVCGTVFNGHRQVLGVQLFVPGLAQFQPLPDSGGEKGAITAINQLLVFRPNAVPGHRVRLHGKVTATHPQGPTWVRDES
jgi:hypothetical protein